MPRFADSKEMVANEDVIPLDEAYRRYLADVEHRLPTFRSEEGHRIDIAEK